MDVEPKHPSVGVGEFLEQEFRNPMLIFVGHMFATVTIQTSPRLRLFPWTANAKPSPNGQKLHERPTKGTTALSETDKPFVFVRKGQAG
jgi:hypothetical protein